MKPYHQLRTCILDAMYAYFREYPYASIELESLSGTCNAPAEELNWNLVYLEKSGYIELDRVSECKPFISCLATLTAKGIDFIESLDEEL